MQNWKLVSLILCTFGLLKELRPSEPFITEYIIDFKNVTSIELIHVAFPVSTYTSLVSLAVVFLVTDFLRYRCIVIFEGFAYVMTWLILVLGEDLRAIIIVEILYGIACSSETAYYTYIYAVTDKKYYKQVTSHTSSALYAGKFLGGLIAQILVSYKLMDYHGLVWLTLLFSCIGFGVTLFLPKVQKSIYFYRSNSNNEDQLEQVPLERLPISCTISIAFKRLWVDLKQVYSNGYILKWSIWWALASAGQYQVINYIQALWEKVNEDSSFESYNGGVKALHTLLSSVMSFGIGYINVPWNKWGESLLFSISMLQGGMLLWMSKTDNLYTAYITYIIFRTIHPVMQTIASAEVAQGISKDNYGLIFGMNTFLALFLQTILTLVVADKKGFAFDERTQFLIYGIYFIFLGSLFLIVFGHSLISKKIRQKVEAKKLSHAVTQLNFDATSINKESNTNEVTVMLKLNNETENELNLDVSYMSLYADSGNIRTVNKEADLVTTPHVKKMCVIE